uniref:NADH-ubiquinone oxidoreductase chain 4 n=1 Tax=Pachycephus cruentatus TaxID=1090886 RepID=A0A1W6Q5C9_9HYME|nr:NADH dehydrogenase subunit 4 [Pachycephus cruentatus]
MMKYFFFILLMMLMFMISSSFKMMMNIIFQNLILIIMMVFFFEFSFVGLNLIEFYSLGNSYGLDFFSYWMVNLSMWIIILMMMASMSVVKLQKFLFLFIMNLLSMLLLLMMTFSHLNFLGFYILFEASLIPTLFLIMGWGYQVERIQAGVYMMLYTLFASLPFLLMLIYLYKSMYSLDMIFLNIMKIKIDNMFMYFIMLFAFLVKMPMFMVHVWLPKAHVEAPVSGSMILAGVMLKLGGYGIYRVIFMIEGCQEYNLYILVFSMVGGILLSLVCLLQLDMKSLVAYSSVVHMSLVIGGLFSSEYIGVQGAYLMMIAHGLCSSGLFCMVNLFYERSMSRSLLINKGMLVYSPSMMMMWFLLCMYNMSAPPSLNLLSEIYLLISLVSWSYFLIVMLMILLFISSCYSLYLYSYVCYGKSLMLFSFFSFSVRDYVMILMHLIPLNLIILKIDILF